jgi:hypothetical protein
MNATERLDSIAMQDSTVRFNVAMLELAYEGKLSAAGKTITGTWRQGGAAPFTFQKTTRAAAWPLPPDLHRTPCNSSPLSPACNSKSSGWRIRKYPC